MCEKGIEKFTVVCHLGRYMLVFTFFMKTRIQFSNKQIQLSGVVVHKDCSSFTFKLIKMY